MKNLRFYSKIYSILMLLSLSLGYKCISQTPLGPGDIAFSGYIGRDASFGDAFSIVLLKAISANTVIKFTDFGWRSTGNRFFSDNATESEITFTANSAMAVGTEITFKLPANPNPSTATLTNGNSAGTVVYTTGNLPFIGSDNIQKQFFSPMSLNGINGDQIFAYQGSFTSPTFISGIHMNVYTVAQGDQTNTSSANWDGVNTSIYVNANTSEKPLSLTTGIDAIWIGVENDGTSELGNARFNCSASGANIATVSTARSSLNNKAYWLANDNDPSNFGPPVLPTGCSYVTLVAANFTTQPANSNLCASLAATFNVSTDQSGMTFQWQEANTVGFSSPVNISNGGLFSISNTTNGSTLTITDNTTKNGKFYRCIATNSGAIQTTSNVVSLTATANIFPSGNVSTTATIGSGNASYFFASGCRLLGKVMPGNVSGQVTVESWFEAAVPTVGTTPFLQRHYQISPTSGTTGTVTLYFTQTDFNNFNNYNSNTVDNLPINASDAAGKANLRVIKYAGSSNDFSGLPASYTNGSITIDPADTDIVFNSNANRWEVTFGVNGFSGFTVQSATQVPLPVTIVSFTAKAQGESKTLLGWKVAEQSAIQTYEIEKSLDAQKFNKIGKIEADEAIQSDYSFVDETINLHTSYYRLKIIEKNGTANYSNMVAMAAQELTKELLYPNPAGDFLTLTGTYNITEVKAEIYSIEGKLLEKLRVSDKGYSVKNLPQGNYFLKLSNGKTFKFMKE